MWKEDKVVISRSSGLIITVIISSILGAVEGSLLCYIFSNLNTVWLGITLGFGLLLTGISVWGYYYFKEAIKAAPSIRPYPRLHSTSQRNNPNDALLDALKASKYPIERKINILETIIKVINQDGKVTYRNVYDRLHLLDSSYQEDEVKDAFEFLARPLLVIKQEKEGEYKLALSTYELKETLWCLSKIFLEPSTKSVVSTKRE
jgi:hypothetical protein